MIAILSAASGGGLGDLGFGKSDVAVGDAALYALVGLAIVVSVLALLVFVFWLSGLLFKSKLMNKPAKDKSQSAVSSEADDGDDEQLMAVITAAITAVYDSENNGDDVRPEFVIRRISRKK